MSNKTHKFFSHFLYAALAGCTLFAYTTAALAWGPDGHSTIGILAINQLQPDARRELASIVSPLDKQTMVEACNWPDVIRETEEWAWSSRQHYINIPRGESAYLQPRDCADGQCATEAIKRYAAELGNQKADPEKRKQAFAWLCHLIGDLHQPLHAGFADDRGGNDFEIIYQGEQINLHGFWDFDVIRQNADNWQELVGLLKPSPLYQAGSGWSEKMVDEWTNESHQLAEQRVYPANIDIDETYEQQSWELAQQRLSLAASRLALVINTVLQDEDL